MQDPEDLEIAQGETVANLTKAMELVCSQAIGEHIKIGNEAYEVTDVRPKEEQKRVDIYLQQANGQEHVGFVPAARIKSVMHKLGKGYDVDDVTVAYAVAYIEKKINFHPEQIDAIIAENKELAKQLQKDIGTDAEPSQIEDKLTQLVKQGQTIMHAKQVPTSDDSMKFAIDMLRIGTDGHLAETKVMELIQSAEEVQKSGFDPKKLADHTRKLFEANRASIEQRMKKRRGKRVKIITVRDIVCRNKSLAPIHS